MSIIERLLIILDKKNHKMSELCSFLNINTSTMANWKTRNTDPPAKYLIPICEFLNISLEYLLTGKETKKTPSSSQLNENESELLKQFKILDKEGQTSVLHTCYQEIRRMREEQAVTTAVSKNVG